MTARRSLSRYTWKNFPGGVSPCPRVCCWQPGIPRAADNLAPGSGCGKTVGRLALSNQKGRAGRGTRFRSQLSSRPHQLERILRCQLELDFTLGSIRAGPVQIGDVPLSLSFEIEVHGDRVRPAGGGIVRTKPPSHASTL